MNSGETLWSIMAKNDKRKMIGLLLCFAASILNQHEASGQRVKVEPEVLSYPGQMVNLRCSFSDPTGVKLTMVTWIYEPKDGERQNIAVFHPNFDPSYPDSPVKGRVSFTPSSPDINTPSIQITNVRLSDEGKYICEYATYPSGNEQGITHLIMLAKPKNSATVVTVNASTQAVVVARCESANGRPPATIKWITTANGEARVASTAGINNTVTVTSEYLLVPTSADNGKDISCSVEHRTQVNPESIPLKLSVLFPPEVEIHGYDNNWYLGRTNVVLTCEAKGNPVPTTVGWKVMSGKVPETVQITGKELKILKIDENVNTTFVCEVNNRIGTGKDQVAAFVREPSPDPSNAGVVAAVVICSLLLILLVAALMAVFITLRRRQQQGYRANSSSDMKTRIFGGGKKASKNGTGGGAGSGGVSGGNNNGPIYIYNESSTHQGIGEKNNHHQPLTMGGQPEHGAKTPTAQDILLSNELDEAERRKFDEMEEEERYDHFSGGSSILQLRPPHDQDDMIGDYLDDDMESQRDGSVISRTAVYV